MSVLKKLFWFYSSVVFLGVILLIVISYICFDKPHGENIEIAPGYFVSSEFFDKTKPIFQKKEKPETYKDLSLDFFDLKNHVYGFFGEEFLVEFESGSTDIIFFLNHVSFFKVGYDSLYTTTIYLGRREFKDNFQLNVIFISLDSSKGDIFLFNSLDIYEVIEVLSRIKVEVVIMSDDVKELIDSFN